MPSSREPPPSAQPPARIEEIHTPSASPSTPSASALVRYQAPAIRETRSQADLVSRASAGELEAGLGLISPDAAEAGLSQRHCKHSPGRSILSYLSDPGDGITLYEAASVVLEELVDKTQGTALNCLQVIRYLQHHALWKDHPNPDIRSAEDFIWSLNGGQYVFANLAMATATQLDKRSRIRTIDGKWNPGWFQEIPANMREPKWTCAEDCSVGILTQMAATASQGFALEVAVTAWAAAIRERTDEGTRRRLGTRTRTTPYLLPSDISSVNRVQRAEDGGPGPSDTFPDNRLKIELVPAAQAANTSGPSYIGGTSPQKRKRRRARPIGEEVHAGDQDAAGPEVTDRNRWTTAADGKSESRRIRGHIVRKPMSLETVAESSPAEVHAQPTESAQSPNIHTCDGPAIARTLRELADALESLDRCCDDCLPHARNAKHYVGANLLPFATILEVDRPHVFHSDDILANEHDDTPPLQRRRLTRTRSQLFVEDSDDD